MRNFSLITLVLVHLGSDGLEEESEFLEFGKFLMMVSKLWCHVDLVLWCGGLMIMVMVTMFYMINNTDPRCPMTQ